MKKRILIWLLCLSMVIPVNGLRVLATDANTDDEMQVTTAEVDGDIDVDANAVPECDCDSTSDDLTAHSDTECSLKAYCIDAANNKTADELYAMWNELPENGKAFILTYLSWGQQTKLDELNELLNGSDSKEDSVDNVASDGTKVTVYGNLPEGAGVEIEENTLVKNLSEKPIYVYDISLTKSGAKYQPESKVTVKLDLSILKDGYVHIYHVLEDENAIKSAIEKGSGNVIKDEEMAAVLPEAAKAAYNVCGEEDSLCFELYSTDFGTVNVNDNSISFETESFSNFIISSYTVDFYYNDTIFSIQGGTDILLSELFGELGIDKDCKTVKNVEFSDETLLEIEQQSDGDWLLTSLRAFDTTELLKVTFNDDEILELKVTDESGSVKADYYYYYLFGSSGQASGDELINEQHSTHGFIIRYSSATKAGGSAKIDFVYCDSNGNKVASDTATHYWAWTIGTGTALGTRFTTLDNSLWFEIFDTTRVYLNEDSSASAYQIGKSSLVRSSEIKFKAYSTAINIPAASSICTTQVDSRVCNNSKEQRTTVVYLNDKEVGRSTVYFPNRKDASDSLRVIQNNPSRYQYAGYSYDSSSKTYHVRFYDYSYRLNYQLNDGTNNTLEPQTAGPKAATSHTFTVKSDIPQRTGYEFLGWANSSSATSADYTGGNTVTINGSKSTSGATITAEKTIYGVWKKLPTYKATAAVGTGISSATGSGDYVGGVSVTFGANVKTGYIWDGWYDGSTRKSTNQSYTFTMPNNAVTYTAKATPNTYKVHFDINTGTIGNMSDQSFTYDVKQKLTANTFGKVGYTFTGWNTKADGSGTSYSNQQEVSNLTAKNGDIFTLYAQWEINSHTATANKETGIASVIGTGTYKYGDEVTFTATVAEGYLFDGWYDLEGQKVSSETTYKFAMPDSDVTYIAKATPNLAKYTVKHMIKDYGNDEYHLYESLENPKEMEGTVGTETKAEPIEIPGYILKEPVKQEKISADGTTVVEIYYDENVVEIKYQSVNEEWGTVDPTQQTVGAVSTDDITGSVPTAKEGFEFAGWYKDSSCTNAVDESWVDSNSNKIIPEKVDGVNIATTYYAKFEPVKSTIKIIMYVNGEMADKTKKFTGKLNYSFYTDAENAVFEYSLMDKEGSDTINVDAGESLWLTDLMTDERYTLKKITLNDTEINKDSKYELAEENIICIYYTSKDVPNTGIDSGHSGAVTVVIIVTVFLVGFLFMGKYRRRRGDW